MTQSLWEKAIRWCKLRHAGFLPMTAFAVSYKTLAQIPKYPAGSFFFPIPHTAFDGFARTQQSD